MAGAGFTLFAVQVLPFLLIIMLTCKILINMAPGRQTVCGGI